MSPVFIILKVSAPEPNSQILTEWRSGPIKSFFGAICWASSGNGRELPSGCLKCVFYESEHRRWQVFCRACPGMTIKLEASQSFTGNIQLQQIEEYRYNLGSFHTSPMWSLCHFLGSLNVFLSNHQYEQICKQIQNQTEDSNFSPVWWKLRIQRGWEYCSLASFAHGFHPHVPISPHNTQPKQSCWGHLGRCQTGLPY
jgi:hypothetical protein